MKAIPPLSDTLKMAGIQIPTFLGTPAGDGAETTGSAAKAAADNAAEAAPQAE